MWEMLFQVQFRLEVAPLQFEKHQISFRICSSTEELAILINFLINYQIDITGKLSVLFFRSFM